MNKGLSDNEVRHALNNKCNIILYKNLYKYDSIDQILDPYGCAVILFEHRPNYGHWVVLIRHKNNLEFFNSYGGMPETTLDYINPKFRKKSNQDFPYLSKLLLKSNYNLHFNEFKFQSDNPNIRTCGRHVIVRALLKHLNIYQYKSFLDNKIKEYGIKDDMYKYDKVVTLLTKFI
jgi:hypothetical protein